MTELPGTTASGVTVAPYSGEEAWHMAAVDWWVSLAADAPTATPGEFSPMPVLSPGESGAYPLEQEALGVSLQSVGDNLTVRAESAGWAWLRVPWDPDWRSLDATPVRKGGPGHLVVWANEGVTELRWSIRGAVDVAAAATTGAAVLVVVALAAVNRRRGWATAPDRPRRAADALGVFADIVDGWVHVGNPASAPPGRPGVSSQPIMSRYIAMSVLVPAWNEEQVICQAPPLSAVPLS